MHIPVRITIDIIVGFHNEHLYINDYAYSYRFRHAHICTNDYSYSYWYSSCTYLYEWLCILVWFFVMHVFVWMTIHIFLWVSIMHSFVRMTFNISTGLFSWKINPKRCQSISVAGWLKRKSRPCWFQN